MPTERPAAVTANEARYRSLFVSEAGTLLAAFGRELVDAEKSATADRLQSLLRHVHTVKSSAAAMGYGAIVELAHAAEDLIESTGKLGVFSRATTDLLLEAGDALGVQVKAIADGAAEPPLRSQLAARLKAAAPLQAASAPENAAKGPSTSRGAMPAAETFDLAPDEGVPLDNDDLPRMVVTVKLRAGAHYPQARGLVVRRKLAALGQLASFSGPDDSGFIRALVITGAPAEKLREAAFRVADVEHVELSVEEKPNGPAVEPMVLVRASALDALQECAGELLAYLSRVREDLKEARDLDRNALAPEIDHLRGLARNLHAEILSARLTPFASLTDRLARSVRDLSARLEKPCELTLQGAEIEADRALLDRLAEPLGHLVRNALDHGIEPTAERVAAGKPAVAHLTLAARRDRYRLVVEVVDDGRGFDGELLKVRAVERGVLTAARAATLDDAEAMQLAFLPGLSTKGETSDVSGRGVGLDAVKKQVEALGGDVRLRSTRGAGATIALELPLNVSAANLLLVGVGGEVFGLPLSGVVFATELDLSTLGGEGFMPRFIPLGGKRVPTSALGDLLDVPTTSAPGPRLLVVLEAAGKRAALQVDRLHGHEEVLLKPLARPLDRIRGLAGVTVLGSGRPTFVLDVPALVALAAERARAM